jgi:carbamoyltransferase
MDEAAFVQHHLEVAGKAMAYAGLGKVDEDAVLLIDKMVAEFGAESLDPAIGSKLAQRREELFPGLSSADLIADLQEYIGRLLVSALSDAVAGLNLGAPPALCITGGCALNIKWNSMIRSSGVFSEVWIPPFPNDAGAAIGAACSELVGGGDLALRWNAYSGPAVLPSNPAPGWSASPCDERELAELLHRTGEAVVVIDGNAELGPRALGNRSIIGAAVSPRMKDQLNWMKRRADYRPVAPICLESFASQVFDPGNADPYMLFDHKVRSEWVDRVPAILHLDGTARLQTINPDTPGTRIGRVLERYAELSGIPLLCNTSANMSGHGFFPDVRTATEWGRTRFVWSDRVLYTNSERPSDD